MRAHELIIIPPAYEGGCIEVMIRDGEREIRLSPDGRDTHFSKRQLTYRQAAILHGKSAQDRRKVFQLSQQLLNLLGLMSSVEEDDEAQALRNICHRAIRALENNDPKRALEVLQDAVE